MATTPPSGLKALLAKTREALKNARAAVEARVSKRLVAHAVAVALTAAAVAVLPLGLSTQLDGLIVVAAGLIAHFLAPQAPA